MVLVSRVKSKDRKGRSEEVDRVLMLGGWADRYATENGRTALIQNAKREGRKAASNASEQ